MAQRFVTIWFRHLKTDWFSIRQPALRGVPFVLASPDHGRMIISAANIEALLQGIELGMVVTDARAIFPSVQILDDDPKLAERLLKSIAKWCIRFTDCVAIDLPDVLILNVTGCAHLWGGEMQYIQDISQRLKKRGYDVYVTMADTIGAAWAIAHYRDGSPLIENGCQMDALLPLPPSALRLESNVTELLIKLGLRQIRQFVNMPRAALKRRFGQELILRMDQALGKEEEPIHPVLPVESFRERLPCLEPIVTATGIEIAMKRLLETLCQRLQNENKGIRKISFMGFRVDNKTEKIEIGTNRATFNRIHLFKLFKEKISTMEPALGFELFMLEVLKFEKLSPRQEKIWNSTRGLEDNALAELMDRLMNRFGSAPVRRYIPNEHHWPESSFKTADTLHEPLTTSWKTDRPRPLQILSKPQPIEVTAPIPDYPPMIFRYQGILHKIKKADGPERIEPEWWIAENLLRDYYAVEDEEGNRYWLFRSGHYREDKRPQWFIHGFFA
ncbi:MAG: DNA polymerase Y family protein [Bacteroidota bacterium]|nr:DNA polymerase Y family protein [Bacteroidota bacterium]